jgi:hypothetical protein
MRASYASRPGLVHIRQTCNDLPMRRTRTAEIALDGDGLITVRIQPTPEQVLADAAANLDAAVAEAGGIRRPVLLDIRRSPPLEAPVRHRYTGAVLTQSFTAIAVLIDVSPLGRMMGSVYLRVAKPGIPADVFSDEPRARRWLKEHLV